MLFFGKVRINIEKLPEYGQKLFSGELDRSHTKAVYCLKDDPSIGLNIWEAKDREDLEKHIEPHMPYFSEIIEISEVMTIMESYAILMKQIQAGQ